MTVDVYLCDLQFSHLKNRLSHLCGDFVEIKCNYVCKTTSIIPGTKILKKNATIITWISGKMSVGQ